MMSPGEARRTFSTFGRAYLKLQGQEAYQKPPNVLKNSSVSFSGPHSGAENTGFVVFWPDFQMFWSFLDYRPVRQRLFQQAATYMRQHFGETPISTNPAFSALR
jgi:hypothetical protein